MPLWSISGCKTFTLNVVQVRENEPVGVRDKAILPLLSICLLAY